MRAGAKWVYVFEMWVQTDQKPCDSETVFFFSLPLSAPSLFYMTDCERLTDCWHFFFSS